MQSTDSPIDPLAILASLGWIDLTALAILLVFLVLGLFRGLVWQVSRLATLVLAYLAAVAFGNRLAEAIGWWFAPDVAVEVPRYLAYCAVFLAALIAVSIGAILLQRLVRQSGLGLLDRAAGGALGVATGALVVMALLTAIHMLHGVLGAGGALAEAAARSRSQGLSRELLGFAEGIVPDRWRSVPERWRGILDGGAAGTTPEKEPEGR